jgi:hypothetical protein
MVRACELCGMWDKITRNGKARSTGYCSHPLVGGVTNGNDKCTFYVRGNTRGPVFDVGQAVDAFEDAKLGKVQPNPALQWMPRAPLDALRARSAKDR